MKAIIVHPGPAWSTADVYRGWTRGLQANGVDVRTFNLDERLTFYGQSGITVPVEKCPSCGNDEKFLNWFEEPGDVVRAVGQGLHAACYQFNPDVVVVISAAFLPVYVYDIIRSHGVKVVIVHTESPYEDERQQLVAGHCDLNLLNDPKNLELWRRIAPTEYVPHAYDPALHHPKPSRWDLDVAWIGTAGTTFPSRMRFIEKVDWRGVKVGLGGLWKGCDRGSPLRPYLMNEAGEFGVEPDTGDSCLFDNDVTADVLAGTKMTFNLYRSSTDDGLSDGLEASYDGAWAMGPREVEACAIGCFMARHSPPEHGGEGDEVLPFLPRFTEPGELSDIVDHFLAHDELRSDLALRARAAVAERTFENHAAQLLRRLDTL